MPCKLAYDGNDGIISAIALCLPFSDQLHLRLVCKSFNKAVLDVLTKHVVLTVGSLGRTAKAAVQGVQHRIPGIALMEKKGLILGSTRVVDVRGFFPPSCDLTRLKSTFPALDILRMTPSQPCQSYTPYVPFAARTVVLFTTPYGFDCYPRFQNGVYQMKFEDTRSAITPRGAMGKLPETVKKIVVNMNGDDIPPADMWSFVFAPPTHVKEIVLVIPRFVSLKDHGSLGMFHEAMTLMDMANLIAGVPHGLVTKEACGPRVPKVKFTIVGLEAISTRPHYAEQCLSTIRKHVAANKFPDIAYGRSAPRVELQGIDLKFRPVSGQAKAAHDKKVDDVMTMIETLTKEQYVQRVGRHVAGLELVERLNAQPQATNSQSSRTPTHVIRDEPDDIGVFRGMMDAFDNLMYAGS